MSQVHPSLAHSAHPTIRPDVCSSQGHEMPLLHGYVSVGMKGGHSLFLALLSPLPLLTERRFSSEEEKSLGCRRWIT